MQRAAPLCSKVIRAVLFVWEHLEHSKRLVDCGAVSIKVALCFQLTSSSVLKLVIG